MNFVPKYFFFLFIIISLTGCGGDDGQNSAVNSQNAAANQANSNEQKINANDNIGELETTIKIPYKPEEAIWREETLAQSGKKLTAVLNFTAENAGKIVAEAEPKKAVTQTVIPVETWFPAELVAQSELSGDDTLKGNVYSAEGFFQPPYTDGRLIRMENSTYFVLELIAK